MSAIRVPLVCILTAACGCAVPASPDLGAATQAAGLRVERAPLVLRHLLSGELEAESALAFVAPNVGQWPIQIQTLPQSGTVVQAGDVVLEFDSSQLTANLDSQRMAVIRAAAELEATRLRTAATVAERALEAQRRRSALEKARVRAAIPAELRSRREYEQLRLALQSTELEDAEASAALEAAGRAAVAEVAIQAVAFQKARDELRYSEDALQRLRLVAPRDGVLVVGFNQREDRSYEANDPAQPGDVVARLPDLRTLRVRARLFDVDDGAVDSGNAATVTLDAYPDESWEAEVTSVQHIAQQPSGRSARRVFDVLVELSAVDPERMRPGMSAKVVVERTIERGSDDRSPLLAPRVTLTFVAAERELAGAGPPLRASVSTGSTARLELAVGGAAEVQVGACNPTHCIVEGIEEGVVLRESTGS